MNTRPTFRPRTQDEGLGGARPQQGSLDRGWGGDGFMDPQSGQFVADTGGGEEAPASNDPPSVPDAEIFKAFNAGFDSMEIARIFRIPESHVWNVFARGDGQ
ncbi:hypothetical protein ACUSIJ_28880 [Pseudochelatococcus sp. B33]